MYIDTLPSTQLYESYEKGNLLTKTDYLQYKAKTLKLFYDSNRVVISEEGADFAIPYLHACETWKGRTAGVTIPLWSLVYHDCVMNFRIDPMGGDLLWGRDVQPVDLASLKKRWLEEVLYGYGLSTWALPEKYRDLFEQSLQAGKKIDAWFAQIVDEEMTGHRFLSADDQLEISEFANGKSVIVNFSNEEKTIDGKTIPAYDYVIYGT
jgi:hypothetical protein